MRRAASCVIAFTMAALLAAVITPTTAARAEDDPVRVTITGLAPVALGVGTSLSIRGTVANTGLAPITSLSVRLTISASPIAKRAELRQAAVSEGGYGSYPLYETTTAVIDTLAPGGKADYRIAIDAEALPLGPPGVYVVGIEAVGYGAAGYVILDTERTLVPYVPTAIAPVFVSWLWPLATSPGQAPDDVLLGELIPRELSPGGRLDSLLTVGASAPNVSWVVDPQVLQVASDMADGYLVNKGGQIRAGTAAEQAAAWLATARTELGPARVEKDRQSRERPLWTLPYADPDANALAAAQLGNDLVRSATAAPDIVERNLDRAPEGVMAWAAGGALDQAALDVLASAGVRTVVVRERAVPLDADVGYTPSGFTDLDASGSVVRALVIDSGLRVALDLPQGNQASILTARQRFLAELAFIALEPASQARYVIAASANPRWDPNPRLLRALIASLRSTPWTRLVPVGTVLALPDTGPGRTLATDASRGRPLTAGYLARVQELEASVQSVRSVLSDPLPVTAPISAALLRAESSAWRTRVREGERLLDSIRASLATVEKGVYVIERDGVVFSGDRGSVPVTVANDFDQPVTVGVSVTADPAARLEAEPLPPVQIEPGRRASLEVPVRVVGGEALTVSVQLTDPSGVPFGKPVALELRTTAYSRAALWVAVAAAVLLGLLVVFDIVRRGRQRRAAKAAT